MPGSKPVFWGKLMLTPHRDPEPRRACVSCAGGGDLNGLTCRPCGGRGWFDAAHPERSSSKTAEADAY